MTGLQQRIQGLLDVRKRKGAFRQLRHPLATASDFSSNDYLGFSRNRSCQNYVNEFIANHPQRVPTGSTGSRLLSGHSKDIEALENTAAQFHHSEDALLFNSGYDANISLLATVASHDDAIVYDQFIHASVHDGMRMSRARRNLFSFQHNDVEALSAEIRVAASAVKGSIIVCIESVYSMDGDIAPISGMLCVLKSLQQELSRELYLIVDEAHSGGLYGPEGEGLCVHLSLESHPNLFARVVTYGKAFAAHGAVVLGSSTLKIYLINYARPLIYSTVLSPHSVVTLRALYAFMKSTEADKARKRLWNLVDHFYRCSREYLCSKVVLHHELRSPIGGIMIAGNIKCVRIAKKLIDRGFDVYPIRSPTVPSGLERIRIIIHAHNNYEEITRLVRAIAQALEDELARPKL
ncbi:Pyridoxal phosphate-dependent transferase [Gracilaria domingensis]|nr:Pyridoxal phosphate-dependent transferase [Gracilaria domingensis]